MAPAARVVQAARAARAAEAQAAAWAEAKAEAVLRVVDSLKARGYDVWVDVQDMSGSTVDAMALAVEGASVMLVCVSRSYKESSNCRLEANYGLQREVPMVPLMMEEGYAPDGWLGLLLVGCMGGVCGGEGRGRQRRRRHLTLARPHAPLNTLFSTRSTRHVFWVRCSEV